MYDKATFVRRKKYDVATFQSAHDGLREYIREAVDAIVDEIQHVRMR